ncbi:calcium-binding protein [Neisseria yangbaofengii]|uniref:calcium-binding protein n=1 Tax=Neisseria yangbaofengii TaxID=2709396 RepID=UPI0013EBFEF4|nr:calcium-binding protein [Neisseria yangbaofengii]
MAIFTSSSVHAFAETTTTVLGGSTNMYGALQSFASSMQKGDTGSILSTAAGVVSTINSLAALGGANNKGSDTLALIAAGTSLATNIHNLQKKYENNENIMLTDVQHAIGDTFQLLGDAATTLGGQSGKVIGLELNLLGQGIKAYGEVALGNSEMSAGDLFNKENWKGFAWDLAERWSRQFYDWLPDEINPWKEDINRDGKYHVYDPLVLDLDGDGIETVGTQGYKGALFDHNSDGIRTSTGWISADDGLLVIDRNGDGLINNGGELFGDSTVLKDGSNAAHGYAALAEVDTNSDGKIDAQDADFAKLKVWRDLNQDGVSQEGELFTLAELNIQSLDVAYQDVDTCLGNGNILAQKGSYPLTGGMNRKTGNFLPVVDHLHSRYANENRTVCHIV